MSKIKKELPVNALLNIYNTLILPRLNYGLMVWGWKSNRLITLHKRAVRIMTKSHFRAHTTNLFQKVNVLKITDLCALQDYKFCFKFEHSMLPHYFITEMKNYFQQNTHGYLTGQTNNLKLPIVRHEFAKHCISNKYPLIFNNMPKNIKEKIYTHSVNG